MQLTGIYLIKNFIDGKVYVGSAINFKKREWVHKSQLNNNKHHSIKLQRAWNKYGENSFEFINIQYCLPETLIENEQYWIDNFDSYNKGYNSTPKAGNTIGTKRSEETKKKIGLIHKGKTISEEHKEKLRNRVVSAEERKKISIALKGRKQTDEHISKRIKANIGAKRSKETCENVSKSLRGRGKTKEIIKLYTEGNLTKIEIANLLSLDRSTVYSCIRKYKKEYYG